MKNAEEQIAFLVAYYSTRRGVGHALALAQGLIRTKDVVVVVYDLDDKRYMESLVGKKLRTVLLSEMNVSLMSSFSPLIVSDQAMSKLMHSILDTLKDARIDTTEWQEKHRRLLKTTQGKEDQNEEDKHHSRIAPRS